MSACRQSLLRRAAVRRFACTAVYIAIAPRVGAAPAGADRKPSDHELEGISGLLDKVGFSCDVFRGSVVTGRSRSRLRTSAGPRATSAGAPEVQGTSPA